jgi:hypothetical protein
MLWTPKPAERNKQTKPSLRVMLTVVEHLLDARDQRAIVVGKTEAVERDVEEKQLCQRSTSRTA